MMTWLWTSRIRSVRQRPQLVGVVDTPRRVDDGSGGRLGLRGRGVAWAAPDWAMALWNRPLAVGVPSSVPTLMPPADSPKIVTLPGSPPKAAMLSRTHSSAATWSSRPRLPEPARSSSSQPEVRGSRGRRAGS